MTVTDGSLGHLLSTRGPPVSLPGAAALSRCAHCDSPLGPGAYERFCCAGCAAAREIIGGLGLDAFYARRRLDPTARPLKPEACESIDYVRWVSVDQQGGVSTLHLMIDGLQCAACVWLIEAVLAREPTVLEGRVNMSTRRLRLRWHGPAEKASALAGELNALGFRVMPYDPRMIASDRVTTERALLRAIAVAGFATGNVMLLSVAVWSGRGEMGVMTRDLMHWVSALIALPALAYAGRGFFRSALGALLARRTNMDVPISIGLLLAAGLSLFQTIHSRPDAYFDSAITLVFFLLIGRYLDMRVRGKARAAAEQLVALGRSVVRVVRRGGRLESCAADSVRAGEIVQVAAGERIGVDGRVQTGSSELDASLVTGETLPQPVQPGAQVFSGMINLAAPLRIEVTATGEATLLAEIARLMEAAEQGRARYVLVADRVARYYAPVVHLLALGTFLGWTVMAGIPWQTALLYAISVLIITCPCALALAVPVVQVAASSRLLRQGILLKSATALERLARVDYLLLDKTGTLTLGRPELTASERIAAEDLHLAASLAAASRHPLARALSAAVPGVPAALGVVEEAGRGLSLETESGTVRLGNRAFCGVPQGGPEPAAGPELWLAQPGRAPGRFAFFDRLREDAAPVVAAIEAEGLHLELISGDRAPTVAAAAQAAGIAVWRAEMTPAEKYARLAALRAAGGRVAMVGDGLNDAPALAAADVSLSPSTAIDISQTAADILFQGSRLAPVLEALRVARRSGQLARQNLAVALGYNLLIVPLAVLGFVTPLIAAAAMSSSSLVVICNALRLTREGRRLKIS